MVSKRFGLLLFCSSICFSTSRSVGDGFTSTEYLNTGVQFSYIDSVLKHFSLPYAYNSIIDGRTISDTEICVLCDIVAELLIKQRKLGMSSIQLTAEVSYFCSVLNLANQRVCDGIIKPNAEIFSYMVDNNEGISGSRICGLLIPDKNCDITGNYEWTVDIPSGKTVDKEKANGTDTFNVVHISDIHYDPLYTPGKSSQCGEPLCCQIDQVDGTDDSDSCGYWSEYFKADIPLHTMQEAFKQIATHEFDYVYFTGDLIRHRVWSTSIENNTKEITTVAKQFHKYFDVPVYPVLGNHEPHPVNTWSSEGVTDVTISTQWLFELVAEQWGEWLSEDAKETILKGGYYVVSPRKGLRVIVLNNNVCYNENWWLINENKDPYGQLAWLADVLLEAETNKESAHILMHMPTGTGSCIASWSREYGRIVRRFSNTITGQFTGHSHKDEFWVYYDSVNYTNAVSVSWNGASLASDKANPSYKLYQIDGATYDVLDFEEWTFNLTLANLDSAKDVEWYKLYSFKDAYGVKSLEPSEVDNLLLRMTNNHSLIQKYYNFKYRNSDVAVNEGCDESCEKSILCAIVTTQHGDNQQCERLEQLYDQNK